ncbi:hypothetical protein MASR2M17_08600 [Aminivibrio sp.]
MRKILSVETFSSLWFLQLKKDLKTLLLNPGSLFSPWDNRKVYYGAEHEGVDELYASDERTTVKVLIAEDDPMVQSLHVQALSQMDGLRSPVLSRTGSSSWTFSMEILG